MAMNDELDLRDGRQPDEGRGRRGRGLGRLRRNRGGGTDVAEREMVQEAEPMTGEPVDRAAADSWYSLAEPVEYDEWGDPVVKGVPRGPNTVGLRRAFFRRDDETEG